MTGDHQNLFMLIHDLLTQGVDPVEREAEVWDRYGETVAVMVLDSTGFSRVSESHGILHFLSKLVMIRNIVEPVVARHAHCSLKFEADNVFAAFKSPDDAIKAAGAIHEAVAKEQVMLTEEEPFKVCIGIGYGRMLHSKSIEGYFGEEMNLASKLGEDTANGGETLITHNTWKHAAAELVTDFERRQVRVSGLDVGYYAAPVRS